MSADVDVKPDFWDGWSFQPEAIAEVMASQPFQSYGDTPAGADTTPLPSQVFLWDAVKKVSGALLPPRNQGNIGTCVAHGTPRAGEYTLYSEIARGLSAKFHEFDEATVYGGSRIEIGKGRLGRGDGSIVTWAAEWFKTYGVVPRGVYGKWDLSKYRPDLCKSWGASGVPDELEPIAKVHPIKGYTVLKNWDECKRALANGCGLSEGSNWLPRTARDKDGFMNMYKGGGHCMCISGYQTGAREGGRIDNSWGSQAHTGPTGAGNPGPEGFWVDANIIDDMCKRGEVVALSGVSGFEVRPFVTDYLYI